MKSLFKKFGSKRAETILEVLVAIFVVSIGATVSTSLVVDALRSNGLSRDNLIALNLAVEGAEAMRNIRDSNWLKFSFNRDDCWNMMPDFSVCDKVDLIQPGDYTAYFDPDTMGWKLSEEGTVLNLNDSTKQSSNAAYMLSVVDADPAFDSNGDTDPDNDSDLYMVDAKVPTLPKVATKFYRMVQISYLTANPPNQQDEMTVTSVVQWQGQGFHQVKIVTKLSDYLKIKVT